MAKGRNASRACAAPVWALRLSAPVASEDLLLGWLWELGTLGVEHADSGPRQTTLIAYFPGTSEPATIHAALHALPGVRLEACPVPQVDWVARFRDGFRAFEAGGFHILPVWDAGASEPAPRTLVVDPGRAFGTGTHETTRLCLRALERLAAGPGLGRVVDVGTGSGLLAIAALRLGAARATGVDNDVEALGAAAAHARLNRVALRLLAADGGRGLRPRCADTLLANLMAPLLLERRDELLALLAPGGRLVLSGLLRGDADPVRDAYAAAGAVDTSSEGDWVALLVRAA